MNAGLPGVGIAGLFFIISALVMPLLEAVRTVAGHGSKQRWRAVAYNWLLAAVMVGVFVAMGWTVSAAVPQSVERDLRATVPTHVSALAITFVLLLALLVVVQLARFRATHNRVTQEESSGPGVESRTEP